MLKLHLRYNLPNYLRILFCYGVYPSHFSCMENSRTLVVPIRVRHKGIILQGIMTPTGVLPNGQSCLRRKVDATGASIHAPRQSNSTYVKTFRRSIYKTRRPEHPHLPIRRYERRPQGPPLATPLQVTAPYLNYDKVMLSIFLFLLQHNTKHRHGFNIDVEMLG